MPIINCSSCGVRIRFPERREGTRGRCPACNESVLLQHSAQPELPSPVVGSSGQQDASLRTFTGKEEISWRGALYSMLLKNLVATTYAPMRTGIEDERFERRERLMFWEYLGYANSHALDAMQKAIYRDFGETDEAWELHIEYRVCFALWLSKWFGVKDDSLKELLYDYWTPDYGDDYEAYWDVEDDQLDRIWEDGTVVDLANYIKDGLDKVDYNVDRYLVFRVNQITEIADKLKFMQNAVAWFSPLARQALAVPFSNHSIATIKEMVFAISEEEDI